MKNITINQRAVGVNEKPYIIAELSANHNGSIDKALRAIEIAASCGVDAIKIQSYTPDTITIDCDRDDFIIKDGLWKGHQLYELYQGAHTPFEWHKQLFDKAKEVGVTLFSTPFDETAVDLLESLNTPAYKVASFELTDLPLIKYIAKTGKPMIMSTGMANLNEIEEAITVARSNGCNELVVLHCISAYPAPAEQSNLATIQDLSNKFNVLTGLSDHTLGTTVSIAASALGACVIEKHFTLDRNDEGPDSTFSIEPDELKLLVEQTEIAHKSIGVAGYEQKNAEMPNVKFRRSIYFVKDMQAGDIITKSDIRRIRPGFGLAPKHYDELLGKTVNKNIVRGTAVSWEHIDDKQ